jgi:hypothetical protein
MLRLDGVYAHRVFRHLARRSWLEGQGDCTYLSDSASGDAAMDALRIRSITLLISHVPPHCARGNRGTATTDLAVGQGTLRTQDLVAQRHHAQRLRADRLHRQARYADFPAARPPRALPWHRCPRRHPARAADIIGSQPAILRARRHRPRRLRTIARPREHRRSMTRAQRLKRVFDIDVSTCAHCGGWVRIVAGIEEPKVIRAILVHFAKHGALKTYRPGTRGPPPAAT